MDATPYNDAVRRYFANPVHAGDLPANCPRDSVAEACVSSNGCRVVLAAAVDNGILRAIRFRAFGCPHLIAAAEAFCADAEGGPTAALRNFDVRALMERLSVPVEKTGRILLLQDAAEALARTLTDGTNRTRN